MKKILVLTNFSENANHAAEFAVELALRLPADVLLFSSLTTNPMLPIFTDGPWLADEGSGWANSGLKEMHSLAGELRLKIEDIARKTSTPKVLTSFGEGDLGLNIKQLCREHRISLIVMGSRTGSGLNHLLYGSDTSSVINQTPVPVLIVPPKGELTSISKMLLATDFKATDRKALRYLVSLAKAFNCKVGVVHIYPPGKTAPNVPVRTSRFLELLHSFDDTGISFHEVRRKDILAGLKRTCLDSGAGLLALVHRKRSFIDALIGQSISKRVINRQQLPLLIYPAKS
jgi:nucleotide-binding universal stress UspA family protein